MFISINKVSCKQNKTKKQNLGPVSWSCIIKFQFSLHQSWVLGIMKVAWLLAAFIAIVTYTPQLTC